MLFVGSDVKVSWKCQSLVHVLSAYHGIFETKFAMKLIRLERAGAGRKVCCYKIIPCYMVVLSFTEISGPGDRDGIIVQ